MARSYTAPDAAPGAVAVPDADTEPEPVAVALALTGTGTGTDASADPLDTDSTEPRTIRRAAR